MCETRYFRLIDNDRYNLQHFSENASFTGEGFSWQPLTLRQFEYVPFACLLNPLDPRCGLVAQEYLLNRHCLHSKIVSRLKHPIPSCLSLNPSPTEILS